MKTNPKPKKDLNTSTSTDYDNMDIEKLRYNMYKFINLLDKY